MSIQSAGGLLAAKSQTLVGAVITSDFTTTSSTNVDITGMTFTLATTNNVGTMLRGLLLVIGTAGQTVVLSLQSTATMEYVWADMGGGSIGTSLTRNADFSGIIGVTTNSVIGLQGYVTGTTSGVIVKVQGNITGAGTLTVRVGSYIYGNF